MPRFLNDIEKRFTYHAPVQGSDQVSRYVSIREGAKTLAYAIAKHVHAGREQSLALTNLEQVVFWANAGIAREGDE